jgi:hypothetical protein
MKERHISGSAQTLALLALVGALVAVIAVQLPDIKRYLSIRSM